MHKNLLDFLTLNFWIKNFFFDFSRIFFFQKKPKIRNFSNFFSKKNFLKFFALKKQNRRLQPDYIKKVWKFLFRSQKNFFLDFFKICYKIFDKKIKFSEKWNFFLKNLIAHLNKAKITSKMNSYLKKSIA